MTLIELLCVMVILCILAALLLPAVSGAYRRAKEKSEEWEAPEVTFQIQGQARSYCVANPRFQFDTKEDFADKCRLAPKCRDWLHASATEFVPFGYLDPTNKVVLTFHVGRRKATVYQFNKASLSVDPER